MLSPRHFMFSSIYKIKHLNRLTKYKRLGMIFEFFGVYYDQI